MRIKCAWCGSHLGSKPPYGGKFDEGFTDGICDDCLAKYFPTVAEKATGLDVTQKDRYPGGLDK